MSDKKIGELVGPKYVYYPDCFYKLEYKSDETVIHFRAFKIEALDEYVIGDSQVEAVASMTGWIKFDGCMEFSHLEHYCGIHSAEQTLELIREIYDLKISIFK